MDKNAVTKIAKNLEKHTSTKHVVARHLFFCEGVARKTDIDTRMNVSLLLSGAA